MVSISWCCLCGHQATAHRLVALLNLQTGLKRLASLIKKSTSSGWINKQAFGPASSFFLDPSKLRFNLVLPSIGGKTLCLKSPLKNWQYHQPWLLPRVTTTDSRRFFLRIQSCWWKYILHPRSSFGTRIDFDLIKSNFAQLKPSKRYKVTAASTGNGGVAGLLHHNGNHIGLTLN